MGWKDVDAALKQPAVQAALLTAGVGFILFALTQWVLHCRERTTLLLQKLELLYKDISTLGNLSEKRAKFYSMPYSREELAKVKGRKLVDDIGMLQAFHFPFLQIRVKGLLELNTKVRKLIGDPSKAATKEQVRKALDELNEAIAETLGLICEKKKLLTKGTCLHYIPIIRIFLK